MLNGHLFSQGSGPKNYCYSTGRRTVSRDKRYLVLADSDYYESVKKRLCNRFPPEGNVIEWQQRLRSRSKERLEVLEDLAMFCYRTF